VQRSKEDLKTVAEYIISAYEEVFGEPYHLGALSSQMDELIAERKKTFLKGRIGSFTSDAEIVQISKLMYQVSSLPKTEPKPEAVESEIVVRRKPGRPARSK
jgi:hypothetical protein